MTEQECQDIWNFGTNGKQFLNVLGNACISQIARSFNCTPLAAWLLDCVFSGLLHPPGFKCWPTANAPRVRSEDSIANVPAWVSEVLAQIQEDADATIAGERKVDIMEAVCVVSLGGAAKTHLLDFFYKLVQHLEAPQTLYHQGRDPMRRTVGNFSALAIMAKKHGKVVYCPDEWGLAIMPARGTSAKGTSASQMMTMQATSLLRDVYRQKLCYIMHPKLISLCVFLCQLGRIRGSIRN